MNPPEEHVNLYGDRLIRTTGSHGADIASQRLDELDKEALHHILALPEPGVTCLDLGCGLGLQGIRLAMLGAIAHLFDLLPENSLLSSLRATSGVSLSYKAGDLRELQPEDLPTHVELAFSQRFIHYLTYPQAERLIGVVSARMRTGGRFYISASGLESELGAGYRGLEVEPHLRFFPLSPDMQDKHDIRECVCLYREGDLRELMKAHGFVERRVWRSRFGNIKGIFERLA